MNADLRWKVQRSRRTKGWYYQAVWSTGATRAAVTLGYLDDEQVALVHRKLLELRSPDRLTWSMWDKEGESCPLPDKSALRRAVRNYLFDEDIQGLREMEAEQARQELHRLLARRDYGSMTLKEFVDHIWKPVRTQTHPQSWKREQYHWTRINAALGRYRLPQLTKVRWTAFLSTQETWGGRTRALAQNAYRQAMRHAVEIGAIEEMHDFVKIKGATTRSLPEPEPLTIEEVEAVLNAARNIMHRALFAYAIGQGLRPGEATALHWDDVDWMQGTVLVRGTKTALARQVVPLMELARTHLETLWESCERPQSGAAFMWEGKPFKGWRHSWATACKQAGITRRTYPYLCRHTFATLAVAAGLNPAAVRGMMRHSSRSTILEEAYTRLNHVQLREGMKGFPGAG